MSNLWFNIRFGVRQFQLDNEWNFSFGINDYHYENPPGKWFEVYTIFGYHFNT